MSREQAAAALWRNLLSMNRELKHTFQSVNANSQFGFSSIAVIFRLENKSMKMNDIADHLGITLGAATSLVDKLERENIVERIRSEEDRRIIYVGLTPQGKNLLSCIRGHYDNKAKTIFENCSEEQLTLWNTQLEQIASILIQHNQRKE